MLRHLFTIFVDSNGQPVAKSGLCRTTQRSCMSPWFCEAYSESFHCQAEGLLKPLRDVEMPLVPVLAQMEAVGVAVEPTIFAKHKVSRQPPKHTHSHPSNTQTCITWSTAARYGL